MNLTTHHHLVLRLRVTGAILHSPMTSQYAQRNVPFTYLITIGIYSALYHCRAWSSLTVPVAGTSNSSYNALRICSCIPDPTGWHPLWFPLQTVDLIDELMVRPVRIIVDDDHVKEVAIFIFHFTSLFDYIFEFILLKCFSTPYFLLLELF